MEIMQSVELWKLVFLFLSVWFSILNAMKYFNRQGVYWLYIVLQSAGITGFIYLQWLM